MSTTYWHSRGAIFLISMIAHKGENIIVGSVIAPIRGEFNISDYVVKCVVTDMQDREVFSASENLIVNVEDNIVGCVIPRSATATMSGLYFISFELWHNGEKVLSNEVEQMTIIE